MEDFRIIYRILKALQANMTAEEWDMRCLSSVALKTEDTKRDALLLLLQDSGYISGLRTEQFIHMPAPAVDLSTPPRITLKGLEYLEENSMMKKAKAIAKGIISIST
jgi:hypothetical protein